MLHEPDFDEGLHPEGPSADDLDRFGDEYRTCRECGHEFYDQAEACPRCGRPVTEPDRGLPLWAVVAGVLALVGIVVVWVL